MQNIKYKNMKVPIPTEESEQVALVQWLRLKKIPHAHTPNEGKMAIQYMKKQKAQGLSKGFPDLTIFLPTKIVFIEMKRRAKETKTGKLSVSHTKVSEEQNEWINTINCYDYAVAKVCYGCEEAIEFIEKLQKY